jgi:hypothetical protein
MFILTSTMLPVLRRTGASAGLRIAKRGQADVSHVVAGGSKRHHHHHRNTHSVAATTSTTAAAVPQNGSGSGSNINIIIIIIIHQHRSHHRLQRCQNGSGKTHHSKQPLI